MNRAATEAEDTLGRVTIERVREIRETSRVVYEDDQIPLPFDGDQHPEPVIDADEVARLIEDGRVNR